MEALDEITDALMAGVPAAKLADIKDRLLIIENGGPSDRTAIMRRWNKHASEQAIAAIANIDRADAAGGAKQLEQLAAVVEAATGSIHSQEAQEQLRDRCWCAKNNYWVRARAMKQGKRSDRDYIRVLEALLEDQRRTHERELARAGRAHATEVEALRRSHARAMMYAAIF